MSTNKPTQPHEEEDRNNGIQVITRAAKVLTALGDNPYGMSLAEIAAVVDLPRSTVQRIVAALDSVQLVRSQVAGGVRLGPALLRLISTANTDVLSIAKPYLEALSIATNETVTLNWASGQQITLSHCLVADRELRVVPRIGMELPLFSTAAGRALLAQQTDKEVSAQLGEAFNAITSQTVKGLDELLPRLAEIRISGVAVQHGETLEDVTSMAVALDTFLGRYAVSLLLPTSRYSANQEYYCEQLLICKQALLAEIGK